MGDLLLTADGPSLFLRPWRDDDATILMRIHPNLAGDADAIRQWIGRQHQWRASGERLTFAVLANDEPVGHVMLKWGPPGSAEVGYWTAEHARGRNVATRALEALGRWAFEESGLTRLGLIHQVDNEASCRVAVKAGFTLAKVLPPQPPWPLEGHLHTRTG